MKFKPLNREQRRSFVRAWIKALRSGKYKQIRKRLCNSEGYCCLGVACAVFNKKFPSVLKISENNFGETCYNKETDILPTVVRRALGIRKESGAFFTENLNASLTDLNDNDYSFKEIAAIIESQIPGLFRKGELKP